MGRDAGMQDEKALGFREYWDIARRRVQLILLTAMALTLVTGIVVRRMPNLYRAETMILVDPQQVPNNYVASTVSTSISDRLSTIHQEVTSPTRLKRLIDSLNLFAAMRQKHSEQEVIAAMQQAITVQVVEQGGHTQGAFKVGFQGKDPVEVAAVANQLAEMFISENLKVRERQSSGTAQFLDDELNRTKEQLDEKQAALNDVKGKYMLDLPESKQYHLEALTTLRNQLQASQDRVSQAQQQKIYLQSMMMTQAPTVDLDSGAGNSPFLAQMQKLEAQLSSLKARYGDRHPDVRKLAAELNELKAKQDAAARESSSDAPPAIQESTSSTKGKLPRNPVLAAQTQKLDDDIDREKSQQQELQQQIALHVGKLEKTPVFEQRIEAMMWDYDSLRNHYSELESKKLSADMASAMEVHDKGERFVVLDRAVVPSQPFSPKRGMMTLGALALGLFAGLGLAVLKEMTGNFVFSKAELLPLLGDTQILADIPRIRTSREIILRRLQIPGAFLATALGSVFVGLAISYFVTKAG